MMNRIGLGLLLLLLAASSAEADRRKYTFTYQFATMPAGETEFEFYQTARLSQTTNWEFRFEVEHGLTDRWDFSVYQIFAQKEGGSLVWDAVQMRTRYKLAPAGVLPVDPLIYLEYNRKLDLKRQNKLEAKLILARDFDRLNIAVNPLYELFFAPGDPVHEIGLDAGLSFEVSYRLVFGVETIVRREFLKTERDETAAYVGPSVSLAHGENYYNFGYVWGLTDDSDDARFRFLMGIGI